MEEFLEESKPPSPRDDVPREPPPPRRPIFFLRASFWASTLALLAVPLVGMVLFLSYRFESVFGVNPELTEILMSDVSAASVLGEENVAWLRDAMALYEQRWLIVGGILLVCLGGALVILLLGRLLRGLRTRADIKETHE